jgi:hypothetical protein
MDYRLVANAATGKVFLTGRNLRKEPIGTWDHATGKITIRMRSQRGALHLHDGDTLSVEVRD